jgi:excisionase family DNA binding protein
MSPEREKSIRGFFMPTILQADDADVRCYTDSEAANILRCCLRHVKNLRLRGELSYSRVGRRVVIRHGDLIEFLERNRGGARDAA